MTNLIITSMIGNACKVVIGVALTLFSPQPQPIYNEYNQYASNYDQLNSGKIANDFGIESLRERMGQYVNGKVLDAAVGTGLQNTYYDWNRISSYNGIDLSIEMLNIAQNKYEIEHGNQGSNANGIPASFTLMDAQALEYSDQTFNTVVDTFSLCVIEDPQKAVSEMARVLKGSGRVVLLENTLSSNPMLATFQHITEPFITPLAKGCKWDVDIRKIAKESGLEPDPLIPTLSSSLGTIRLEVFKKSSQ